MKTCGLCGKTGVMHGRAGDVDLCHPNDGQDCYHLWTVYQIRDRAAAESMWAQLVMWRRRPQFRTFE